MAGRFDLGLDIGSTTVKAVLLDSGRVAYEEYRRHNADIRAELAKLLDVVAAEAPEAEVPSTV